MKILGDFLKGFAAFLHETQERKSRVCQLGEHAAQARLFEIMSILIPPTIFHEVQAVFHLPMIADQSLKVLRRDEVRIETADQETGIMRLQRPIGTEDVTVHASKNFATGNIQPLTNELCVRTWGPPQTANPDIS